MKFDISDVRSKIDQLDDQIIEFLTTRLDLAALIGQMKKEKGLPIEDLEREKLVLNRLKMKIKDENHLKYIELIYKEIFRVSKEYQAWKDLD